MEHDQVTLSYSQVEQAMGNYFNDRASRNLMPERLTLITLKKIVIILSFKYFLYIVKKLIGQGGQ